MNRLQALEIAEGNEIQEGFKVTDKASATWCLRKIQAMKTEIAENDSLAKAEIDRIKAWQEKENQKSVDSIKFFESLLEIYIREQLERDGKTRSIKLPHGTIRLKKQQPEWVMDESKTLTWLKENYPDKIQIVEKFSKTDVKNIVKETGEIWDGLEIIERDYKFEVEVA